ncbi:MAG TPA: MmgE/PrpD family protein [Chloroflexota bacterium]|nr:MmgE/PrpD family protein [Chloroflexota bacterium]
MITEEVAGFVCELDLDRVPRETIAVAKRHILDTLGVIVAGIREEAAHIAIKHAAFMCGGERPAPMAAFVYGLLGHVLDYDDTQLATRPAGVYGLLTHPSVPILSAALAAARAEKATGRQVLASFIASGEAECRLSDAIDPRHYREGFHSSGTVGTLGATLASAKVLGLDVERTRMALGIGASSAAGLRENFGTMTKSLHVGRAAQHGVEAAFLTRAGFTAANNAIEAPRGFMSAFGGGFDENLVHGKLGRPWYYLDPGVSIKPHPSGSLGHPAMWALGQMIKEHDLTPANVDHITVGTSSNIPNALIHHRPKDDLAAKFSMEYSMATLLVRRKGGLAEYAPDAILDPAVQEVIPRVELVVDPVAEEAGFHRMLSRITVRLKDGRELFAEGEAGRGHPDNPMSDDEVRDKFRDCARWGGLPDDGERLIQLVDRLEELGSVEELCSMLP